LENVLVNIFIIEVLLVCALIAFPAFQWLGASVLMFWSGFALLSAVAATAGAYVVTVRSLRTQASRLLAVSVSAMVSVLVGAVIVGVPIVSVSLQELVILGLAAGGAILVLVLSMGLSSIRSRDWTMNRASLRAALELCTAIVLVAIALGLYWLGVFGVAVVLAGK
jgi:hypothetical protein